VKRLAVFPRSRREFAEFVNDGVCEIRFSMHAGKLVIAILRVPAMWMPGPIYKRFPQFWLLLGLLFIASSAYLGFQYKVAFWYAVLGLLCCAYGAALMLLREMKSKKNSQIDVEPATPEQ